ncbi:MAG: glycosyltransferase family 4 protein, partial [Nanoarchaeota archaeon]|nr:glycosyltransferase family 4 protein [Nanoarchaeota archaeon]
EVCPYSAGICGVWTRVLEESKRLSKLGFEIKIFSSYFEKGTDKIMPTHENLGKIKIQRFPAKKLGGESFMSWDFEKEALEYSPDIIIVHNYRHLHTTKCLKIAEKLRKKGKKCKVFLVTHAPFPEGNITRTKIQTAIVKFYDKFIGPRTLNKFDKILAISHWEIPFLLKAGAKKNKIVYIPNGIPEEFFTQKKTEKEENKILYLGRVSPKKKLETLIRAISYLKDKKIKIEIVGPRENDYYNYLLEVIKKTNTRNRIKFSESIYDIKNKIKKLDSAKIYILASRVEGMPQSLIEAMARGKIVIGSNSIAIRDLIKNKENGFLFEFDNPRDLAKKIDEALQQKNSEIKKQARKSVEHFSWDKVIKKIEKLIR